MIDWKAITKDLGEAVIAVADDLLASIGRHRLYAICLLTDDDGGSVGFWAATEEDFERRRASEAEADEMTPAYEAYLRWTPEEWSEDAHGDVFMRRINKPLFAEVIGGTSSPAHFDRTIEAMTDALALLRAERADKLADVTLFVSVSDSEDADGIERRSVALLNPPALISAFRPEPL
ncbi:DUF4303 domain-containing protein [Sphingomonas sanxanigenens]|uniref:DUF4303 domain-containing protein n=1 Tax=Sphingomonas sanxanigenens DSM 19645 = NX02 TaxID=1123269 RepID=W0AB27_9SPHN|nr:DUF4303 domain-containing protein [Sphingomonas sanxanigenens]AHE53498.1 hypothetical protein NX02_08875 [Sphingomonas sanxanigenens DSM 19645 = NX02]